MNVRESSRKQRACCSRAPSLVNSRRGLISAAFSGGGVRSRVTPPPISAASKPARHFSGGLTHHDVVVHVPVVARPARDEAVAGVSVLGRRRGQRRRAVERRAELGRKGKLNSDNKVTTGVAIRSVQRLPWKKILVCALRYAHFL